MKDQKKIGVSLSYLNLILNTIINLFLTPFMIKNLGDTDYSILKVMQSFSGPLIMFNLGVSTVVARAIVKNKTLNNQNVIEKQNTIGLAMITSSIMSVLVGIIGLVMYMLIPSIYCNSYDSTQLIEAQKIFIIFVLATIIHILTDSFNGCAIGHERFAFNSSLSLIKNIVRVPLIICSLKLGFGAFSVALMDFVVAILVFLLSSVYALFVLKEFPKITGFKKSELFEILSFSLAILLQAVVNQVNNNVDTMILGAVITEKAIITMYSSALFIYSVYNSVVSVMSDFFLPKATKLITKNASGEELTDFVIKPGRYQSMIAVAVVFGFAVLGKDFISLWIGSTYINAYYIVLILIIPVTIPLVENTAIAILNATMKRIFRSLILVIMSLVNVVLTLVLIRSFSYWGAAVGTFISLCVGHVFLMNWYYSKTFSMNIPRMFKEIFKGILPVGLVSGLICLPLIFIKQINFFAFGIKAVVFCVVYSLLCWRFALKNEEKECITQMLHIRRSHK